MAFEQIKTQVLILHSQQNELEALGAGFGDQFAVHLATTGSEALTTLSETPIHVIVSALDLPGMSGIETLREAKKRVPDMLGILLAGERDSADIEALVGEKEVYQVVRGNIATNELVDIVASAAREVRMLTLSKSANDNEAAQPGPDSAVRETAGQVNLQDVQHTGEHIILETLDNGAAQVTDVSSRLPILKPVTASANAAVAAQSVDVLVLSKDHTFVDTIRAAARGLHTVHHAITAHQAQEIVASNEVGVLVTDAAIAGNKVALLTHKLRSRAPRLVAIIAGRRDDGESLMELINKGQIYRFLLKPVSAGRAKLAVEASAKYHLEAPDSAFLGRKQGGNDTLPSTSGAQTDALATIRAAESTTNVDKVTQDEPTDAPVQADEFVVPPDQHLDMDAPVGFENRVRLPLIPTAIAGAAVLSIGAWYFLSNLAGDAANPRQIEATPATGAVADAAPQMQTAPDSAATAASPIQSTPNSATEDAYVSLLDNARFARDSGRLLVPENDNALRWYLEARLAAPDNAIVRDELAALIDQLIGRAETAMLENRIGDVDEILQKVTSADPANSRLAFLRAQRDQQQVRATLNEARAAIRDGRFLDADQFLSVASTLPGIIPAAIEPLVDDLAAARGAQQVDELLALANLRLAENRLTAPPNDNARYFFELAAVAAPDEPAVQQGLQVVASRLVLNARSALDSGDLATAEQLLAEARTLDAESQQLLATDRALRELETSQAKTALQESTSRVAPTQEATDAAAVQSRPAATVESRDGSTRPANADAAAENDAAAEPASNAVTGSSTVANNASGATLAGTKPAAVANQQASPVPGDVLREPAQSAPTSSEPEWATMGQLTRRNYVAPLYPRNARRRNISGWVSVGFTVTQDGSVSNLEIIDSLPGKTFNEAALHAVGQWRFEPIIENGRPVAKRVAVKMRFDLQ